MPYIQPEIRAVFEPAIKKLANLLSHTGSQAGDLNYIIATLVSRMIAKRGCRYAVLNEFIGSLECCKLELYRRIVAPHENNAVERNGDVFDES